MDKFWNDELVYMRFHSLTRDFNFGTSAQAGDLRICFVSDFGNEKVRSNIFSDSEIGSKFRHAEHETFRQTLGRVVGRFRVSGSD